jgi:hypothetical protein
MSEATHRLAHGYFECDDLGPQRLKGVSSEVRVYRVRGESAARSRLEVAVTTGLTPLVGREQETSLLLERWEQVREGLGQVVLLSGEAGVGKSRLVQVMKERVADEPHTWLECRGSPYHQNSALYPVIELLQRMLDWTRESSAEDRLRRLEELLAGFPLDRAEAVPLLASLLSIPLPAGQPDLGLSSQRQKQKTLEVVLAMLLDLATRRPVLLVVEDLHWVDPSTLELLGRFIDQGPAARILTLLTCRPDFVPPWACRSHLTYITLNRLSRRHVEVMVTRLTGGRPLPPRSCSGSSPAPTASALRRGAHQDGARVRLLREADGALELIGPLRMLSIPNAARLAHGAARPPLGRARRGPARGDARARVQLSCCAVSPLESRSSSTSSRAWW